MSITLTVKENKLDKMKKEIEALQSEMVVMREIIKKIGWAHVQMIRKAAQKENHMTTRESMKKEAESLTRFLSFLKDGGQQAPHAPVK